MPLSTQMLMTPNVFAAPNSLQLTWESHMHLTLSTLKPELILYLCPQPFQTIFLLVLPVLANGTITPHPPNHANPKPGSHPEFSLALSSLKNSLLLSFTNFTFKISQIHSLPPTCYIFFILSQVFITWTPGNNSH